MTSDAVACQACVVDCETCEQCPTEGEHTPCEKEDCFVVITVPALNESVMVHVRDLEAQVGVVPENLPAIAFVEMPRAIERAPIVRPPDYRRVDFCALFGVSLT